MFLFTKVPFCVPILDPQSCLLASTHSQKRHELSRTGARSFSLPLFVGIDDGIFQLLERRTGGCLARQVHVLKG